MTPAAELRRRALLQRQAAQLLRNEADEREKSARVLEDEAIEVEGTYEATA